MKKILIVLILIICICVGGIGFYEFKVNQIIKPETISQKDFDELKEKAKTNIEYYKFLDHIDAYPKEIIDFLIKDEDRFEFVKEYPNRDTYTTSPDTIDADLNEVPLLLQWDLNWGYTTYGEDYLYLTGCAPTCLSMVLSYLKQDPTITPAKVAQYSMENNFYVNGVGTSWELLDTIGTNYDITSQRLYKSQETIQQALDQGHILIASMYPGSFTDVGHFIVIRGYKGNKVIVNDPNSIKKSNKKWDFDTFIPQIFSLWEFY